MRLSDTFQMAFLAITRNKIRSFLTALGIIIGVGSVIAMVHVGQAATQSVTDSISSMGSNLLIVSPARSRRGPGGVRITSAPFTIDDVETLDHEIQGILVAPEVSTNQSLVYANVNHNASILGTTNNYFEIRNYELDRGRYFEPEEIERSATVCIIGSTVHDTMFGRGDPLGNNLRVGRTSCEVVGVLQSKGASFGRDLDDVVVMPTGTVQSRILGNMDVRSIQISAVQDGTTARIKAEIEELFRERRGGSGREDDFFVRDMQEVADTLEGTTRTLTMLLGAIAAISLLVGGIGIMNIMLVSVTERTREIGIRIAIGAQVKDVMIQFLVEAVALSCLGGLLGVGVGIAGTHFATQAMDLPFVLSMDTILIGFGFSAFVGVVFGFFPARKAANLNPIEALRHE